VTTVLKLGGSVVTEKAEPETVATDRLARAVDAVAAVAGDGDRDDREGLVLVHGGGSFGHHHAGAHGVGTESGTHDPRAVEAIHGAMVALNRAVVDALLEREVPAVPVHPLSVAHRDGSGSLTLPTGATRTLLEEGFVPVTHGDLVAHTDRGVTVVSGDELVVSLAGSLGAGRVGLCSDVPGVLDPDGRVIDHVDSFATVADAVGTSANTDVTGGMAAKVEQLLSLSAPARVFDLDGLSSFLAGEEPGTLVD
jgi:isopentenyl phosphate kinase